MKDAPTQKELLELQARRTRQDQLREYLSTQIEMKKAQETSKREASTAWAQRQRQAAQEWEAMEAQRKVEAAERSAAYRAELDKQMQTDRTRKLEARTYQRLGPMGAVPGANGEDLPYTLLENVAMNTMGVTVRYTVVPKPGTATRRPGRNTWS
uniref:Uncharacterized protein n=1 Tax=Chlamydomonas leiostraca TaxID=1034604 RepID=A0A7S0S430_9CHLO|mmetsp:Transcript_7363/g.18271  ORF Transcript_7363/g.18271 Transcript_7363/m.18271 type:complete len:154 (+) Transcript_7363:192-653(+)